MKERLTSQATFTRKCCLIAGASILAFVIVLLQPNLTSAESENTVSVTVDSEPQVRFRDFFEFYAGTAFSHEADVSVTFKEAFVPEIEEERHVDFGRAFSAGFQWRFESRKYPLGGGIDFNYITSESKDVDMDLYLLTPFILLNHRFLKTETLPDGKAGVYAGIGLTLGSVDVTIDFRPEIPETINASGTGAALSYMAGGLWSFTDRIALFLQYRYLDISLDIAEGEAFCLFCARTDGNIDLVSQQVVSGVSLHF